MRSEEGPPLKEMHSDKIFEEKSIDQVKEMVRNLQRETDRKREELRSLVGERYRDLMEAAETIICMRDTSSEVLSNLKLTQESMSNLNLKNFRSKFEADSEMFSKDDEAQYALAAQIKLLMDIPERIWSAVDAGELVTATKLYLFARHIHINLTFQNEESLSVIERQWAAISQFHEIIKNASDVKIGDSLAEVDEALDAMLSVILLKGSKGIFETFLKKRQEELSAKLKRHDISAKNHISGSLCSIASLLVIVHKAFYSRELKSEVSKLSQEKTFQLLNANVESPVMEFLPSIVKDFKLMNEDFNDFHEPDFVKDQCAKWLDDIHDILTKETSIILSHVHNIDGLSNIRSSVFNFLSKSKIVADFDKICSELLGHEINLWEEFYHNLFRDRIEAIIATHFAGTTYFLQSSLADLQSLEQELVIDYMMSEAGLKEAGNLMTLKAKAVSPKIKAIGGKFNELLETIIKDIKEYMKTNEEDFILQCVQKCSLQNIEDFCGYVEKHSGDLSSIGVGRLLQNLPDLCPALRTCSMAPKLLKINDINDFNYTNKSKNEPEWQTLKTKLENLANQLFSKWVQKVTQDLQKDLKESLINDAEHNLKMMPAWDSIEISEEGEDGQIVKSKIRVPLHLSLPFYDSTLRFCQAAYKIGIHSLPSTVQLAISQKAALTFADVYLDYLKANSKLTQNVALQLHFDIQFVIQGMISRESDEINTKCKEVLSLLENHIDPFDFSVFHPFIEANVKRCILRHQSLISVMIPTDRFALLASLKASIPAKTSNSLNGHVDQPSDHNSMILAASCPKFSILPISTNQRGRDPVKQAKTLTASNLTSNKSTSPSVRKRSRSPVAKAANSFFEAMSNSWFGTK